MILENNYFVENKLKKKNKTKNNKSIKKGKRESVVIHEERYEDIFSYYEKNERIKKSKLSSRGTIFIF